MSTFTPCSLRRRVAGAFASSFLALCAAGAQAQVADWQSNVSSCTPSTAAALAPGVINTAGGFVRAPLGPNPPIAMSCNVLDSFAAVASTWNWLRLQYNAPVNGAVTAQLFQKDKITGAVVPIAFVASTASAGVANVQAPVPPGLDFANNSFYVVVTMNLLNNFRVQAHMVTLAQ